MTDWTEADVSRISETEFPVRCGRCDCALFGLGERGRCPECGQGFSRRERLWETHGPEAFADPEFDDEQGEADDANAAFVFAVFSVLLFTALFPLIVLIGKSIFGTIDLCFTVIAWLIVAFSLEWIAFRRFAEHREAESQARGGVVDDEAGD